MVSPSQTFLPGTNLEAGHGPAEQDGVGLVASRRPYALPAGPGRGERAGDATCKFTIPNTYLIFLNRVVTLLSSPPRFCIEPGSPFMPTKARA